MVTSAKTAEDAVLLAGISLRPGDRILPAPSAPLYDGAQISVERSARVFIDVEGQHLLVQSTGNRVQDALNDAGVQIGPNDQVEPGLSARLHSGEVIAVHRIEQRTVATQVDVPYDTERRQDPSLASGVTKTLREGQTGVDEVTNQITYRDGQAVSSERVSVTHLVNPVAAVLAYGTLNTVSRGGVDYHFSRAITLTATGYTAGKESNPDGNGITATGVPARRGIVAVDPRVIPLYTRVYVQGYGPAIAADTGGAIKGNRIDLCFDQLQEALDWGVRDVTVYILGN